MPIDFSKQRARLAAIKLLGGRCAWCDIEDPVVLNIDHVENDGAIERQDLNPSQLCAALVNGTVAMERYQLLCCNCNWRKEYFRRTGEVSLDTPPTPRGNQNLGKPSCAHGHAFTEENTYFRPDGGRGCRACGKVRTRKYSDVKCQPQAS